MYEKLKRALVVIKKRQKISDAFYEKLMNDQEIPKKMKKLVKEYRLLVQSGGINNECSADIYALTTPIGESGAYGANFLFKKNQTEVTDPDRVLKIYAYNDDNKSKTDAIIANINYFLNNATQDVKNNTSVVQNGHYDCVSKECIQNTTSETLTDEHIGLFFKKYDGDLDNLLNSSSDTKLYDVLRIIEQFNNNANNAIRFVHGDMKYNNMLYNDSEIVIHDIDGFLAYNNETCSLLNTIAKSEHIFTPEFTHPLFYPYIIAASASDTNVENLLSNIPQNPQINEIMWRMSMTRSKNDEENEKINYIQSFYKSLFNDNDEQFTIQNKQFTIQDKNHLIGLLKVFDLYSFVLSVFYKFYFSGQMTEQNLIYLIFLYTTLRQKISSVKPPPVELLPKLLPKQSGGLDGGEYKPVLPNAKLDPGSLNASIKQMKYINSIKNPSKTLKPTPLPMPKTIRISPSDKPTPLPMPKTIRMSPSELQTMYADANAMHEKT